MASLVCIALAWALPQTPTDIKKYWFLYRFLNFFYRLCGSDINQKSKKSITKKSSPVICECLMMPGYDGGFDKLSDENAQKFER